MLESSASSSVYFVDSRPLPDHDHRPSRGLDFAAEQPSPLAPSSSSLVGSSTSTVRPATGVRERFLPVRPARGSRNKYGKYGIPKEPKKKKMPFRQRLARHLGETVRHCPLSSLSSIWSRPPEEEKPVHVFAQGLDPAASARPYHASRAPADVSAARLVRGGMFVGVLAEAETRHKLLVPRLTYLGAEQLSPESKILSCKCQAVTSKSSPTGRIQSLRAAHD